jgi:hypothetical protein
VRSIAGKIALEMVSWSSIDYWPFQQKLHKESTEEGHFPQRKTQSVIQNSSSYHSIIFFIH